MSKKKPQARRLGEDAVPEVLPVNSNNPVAAINVMSAATRQDF
jgi:hypothetical protein